MEKTTEILDKLDMVESMSFPKSWLEIDDNPGQEGHHIKSGLNVAEPDSVVEGGRSFHAYKQGKYILPNDGVEQDRLDLQHRMHMILLDDQFGLAPTKDPKTVLDIGTGTGIWALEYAERNPSVTVMGTDLSLIQPPGSHATHPNCSFYKADAEDPWEFGCHFDYVHLRATTTCFHDTRTVIKHAFDNMNPGGYIEFQDPTVKLHAVDNSLEGTAVQKLARIMAEGMRKMGREFSEKPKQYKQWLLDAGFVNIVEKQIPIPVNHWPKDPKFKAVGQLECENLIEGSKSMGMKLLPAAGLSPEEAHQLLEQAWQDWRNPAMHAYVILYVVHGQKPEHQL